MKQKYRKKPIEIEAMRFYVDSETIKALADFMGGMAKTIVDKGITYLEIETLEGKMRASAGDFIIRGIAGGFYPCRPDIFLGSYDVI